MNRVKVRIDEEFEKDFPRRVHMRMTATDRAGKTHQVYIVNPLGHEDNPVSAGDLATKFLRLCEPRLGAEGAAIALRQWQNIDELANVGSAFDAIVVDAASETHAARAHR